MAVPSLPGYEVHPLLGQAGEPLVVGIPTIEHHNRARFQGQLARYLNLRLDGGLDHCVLGQIAVVIQQQMQLHSTFGAAKFGPVIHACTEVNHTAIQAQQLILEPEFLPSAYFSLALLQQLLKYLLGQLPRAMFIRVGQRRSFRALIHPQVSQLAFTSRQTAADLSQRLRSPQMTEQHRHHLAPTAKSTSVMLRPVLANCLLKLGPRKYPQNLRKNTAYSTHGGSLLAEIGFPARIQPQPSRLSPSSKKPNLDKTG